jgi:hypothetical protein
MNKQTRGYPETRPLCPVEGAAPSAPLGYWRRPLDGLGALSLSNGQRAALQFRTVFG